MAGDPRRHEQVAGSDQPSSSTSIILLVVVVGAVVALGATGFGLLVPAADLDRDWLSVLRIAGAVAGVAGAVWLLLLWRRAPRGATGRQGMITAALVGAGVLMSLLALLSLPTSDVTWGDAIEATTDDEREWSSSTDEGSSSGSDSDSDSGSGSGSGTGTGGSDSFGDVSFDWAEADRIAERAGLEGELAYTVARDNETGELMPVVVEADGTRAVVIDPDTRAGTLISAHPSPSGPNGGWSLPVGIDRTTGEASILGMRDPEFGNVEAIAPVDDLDSIDWDVEMDSFDLDQLEDTIYESHDDAAAFDDEADDVTDDNTDRTENESNQNEDDESEEDEDDEFDWGTIFKALGLALMVALLAAALIGAFGLRHKLRWRRTRKELPPPEHPDEPPVSADDAEAGLRLSLSELADYDGDPREMITAAYQTLLAALAAAGAPRLPQEAPHEHLHRALVPLGIRPDPLHRLADLYVLAQFSERRVTLQHKAEAVHALETSLADLRASGHWPEDDLEDRPAEASV